MVVFKDSNARVGRPRAVVKDKTIISATSPSRSLSSLTPKQQRIIKVEILDNGYLVLDFSSVIGNKVRVSKTYARKLAKWIEFVYEGRRTTKK